MSDPDFRRVFPDVEIDMNKKSIERLGTMSAGVIHAIPTSGKMTGKGCGALVEGFAGMMCIDDVIKPHETRSKLITGLKLLETKVDSNPKKKHGNIPL